MGEERAELGDMDSNSNLRRLKHELVRFSWSFSPSFFIYFYSSVFLLHGSSQIWADNICYEPAFIFFYYTQFFLRVSQLLFFPLCVDVYPIPILLAVLVLERNTKSATNHLIGSGYLKMRPLIGWHSPFCNDLKCECWFMLCCLSLLLQI